MAHQLPGSGTQLEICLILASIQTESIGYLTIGDMKMGQKSLYVFITPEELAAAFKKAIKDTSPNLLRKNRVTYNLCSRPILEEIQDLRYWRFVIGYGALPQESDIDGSYPWNSGYIQFDNPIWSSEALREVHFVIQTGLPQSEEYDLTLKLYQRLCAEVKKISTRGEYICFIKGERLDTRNWLSEGARQWILSGGKLTVSAGPSLEQETVVIHKLAEIKGT